MMHTSRFWKRLNGQKQRWHSSTMAAIRINAYLIEPALDQMRADARPDAIRDAPAHRRLHREPFHSTETRPSLSY
jgi:hypothetical protein